MPQLVLGLGLPLGCVGVPREPAGSGSPTPGRCVPVPVLHPQLSGVWSRKGRQSCRGWRGPHAPSNTGAGDVATVGPWQRAGMGPLGSRSPSLFGRVRGGTLPALGMCVGREGPAGLALALLSSSPSSFSGRC